MTSFVSVKRAVVTRVDAGLVELERNIAYQILLLTGIVLVAAVLRFYQLSEWSFWIDEIYSLSYAQTAMASQNILPLSTYLAGGAIELFGTSEWGARLGSVLIGLATLPLLYLPVKRAYGTRVALLSALLLAVSPWHLYWSQNMRFYTMLLLLYTVLLFTFYRIVEERQGRYRNLLLFLVVFVFAISERLIAFFIVPVAFCYLILRQLWSVETIPQLRMRRLAPLLLVSVAVVTVFALFPLVRGQDSAVTDFFLRFVGVSNKNPFRFFASFTYWLGIPVLGLGLAGGIYVLSKRDRLGLLLLVSALLPPVLLTVASPFVFTIDRYAFVSLPSWLILAAVLINQALSQKAAQYGRIFGLAMLFIVVSDGLSQDMLYHQYYNGARENWKGAFALVQEKQAHDDLVFTNRPELGEYYLNQEVGMLGQNLPEMLQRREQRAWLVVSTSTSYVSPAVSAWIERNCVLIDVLDVHVPGKVYDMRVYLYDPLETGLLYEPDES